MAGWTHQETAKGTADTATLGVGATAGDLLFGFAITANFPAGWTIIRNNGGFITALKTAAGGETSLTVSGSGLVLLSRFTGDGPPLVDGENGQSGSGTAITAPSVSPAGATDLLIFAGATIAATTITPPSGMTEPTNGEVSGFGITLEVSYQVLASSGATGTRTATAAAAGSNGASLVAFKAQTGTAVTPADSGTLSTTEAASIRGTVSVGATGALSTAETASVAAQTAAQDAGVISTTETPKIGLAAVDSGILTTTEQAAVSVLQQIAVSDSGTLTTTEAAAVAQRQQVSVSDSGTLGTTEGLALTAQVPVSDSGLLAAAEGAALSAVVAVSESGLISTVEQAASGQLVQVTDSGTLTSHERAAVRPVIFSARTQLVPLITAQFDIAPLITGETAGALEAAA